MRTRALLGTLMLLSCGRTSPYIPGPTCALSVEPRVLAFGDVAPLQQATLKVTVKNEGRVLCTLETLTSGASNDPTFSITAPSLPRQLSPGQSMEVPVTFSAGPPMEPFDRVGTLTFASTDPDEPTVKVALSAKVSFCQVAAVPSPFDFGNVALNTTASGSLTLKNTGSLACDVSNLALAAGTDSHFSFATAPGPLHLDPSASAPVPLRFAATDSAPPHLRTGTLTFDATDEAAHHQVPLSAFINTICTEAGQFIFTVDSNGRFSRFEPRTQTYVDVTPHLSCPSSSSPFSMNVDQSGIAWVIFSDSQLFRVETSTGACTATSYVPGQAGFTTYGMGSMWNSQTATDTLFISGNGGGSQLGILALPALTVTRVGSFNLSSSELAGTGDGQLWAFSPAGIAGGTAELGRLDPSSGALLEHYTLPNVTSVGGWAIKFFAGSFFIFIGTDVWKLDRAALDPTQPQPTVPAKRVLVSSGRDIVGAGVSTCAPVQ
jgi:streptogramin lyase